MDVSGEQLEQLGYFGTVIVQAKLTCASRYQKDNSVKQVAVKMIKSTLDPYLELDPLEFLASELKMLIHLDPHL